MRNKNCSLYTQVIYKDCLSFSIVSVSQPLWLTRYTGLGINFKFILGFFFLFLLLYFSPNTHSCFCVIVFLLLGPWLSCNYISFPGVLIALFYSFSVFAFVGFLTVFWMNIKSLLFPWSEVWWLTFKSLCLYGSLKNWHLNALVTGWLSKAWGPWPN